MKVHGVLRGTARLIVAATAVATLLLALGFAWGDERTWWIELLRYVPFPAWLLPALLSVVVALGLGWRWCLVAWATLGLVLTAVMGLSVGGWRGAQLPQEPSLRVMTYNIKSYKAEGQAGGYEDIAEEIALQAPDVLVMQDAQALNDEPPGRHAAALRAVLRSYRARFGDGQFVVASRHPLSHCQAVELPAHGGPLDYVRCTVQVDGRPVTLVTTHTLSPRKGLNATRHEAWAGVDDWRENFRTRLDQTRQLARELERLPRPLIVAGDLNAPEQSPVVRDLLEVGLRDAHAAAGVGWGYTIGHALRPHLSFVRIDHILVSPDIGVQRSWTGGREGSEHRPVMADLQLTP